MSIWPVSLGVRPKWMLFILLLAGCASPEMYSPVQEPANVEYRLGSGDLIRVTVFGHPDLSGEFQVGSGGTVSLPLIGEVAAQERTITDLEVAVVEELQPRYLKNPQVSVEVVNYRPFYILGEVRNPGSYPYVAGMKVVNAIALAGGYADGLLQRELFITRAKNASGAPEPAFLNSPVLPGDIIEVPKGIKGDIDITFPN